MIKRDKRKGFRAGYKKLGPIGRFLVMFTIIAFVVSVVIAFIIFAIQNKYGASKTLQKQAQKDRETKYQEAKKERAEIAEMLLSMKSDARTDPKITRMLHKESVYSAVERGAELERQGFQAAVGIIDELRKRRDWSTLLTVLEIDRDINKDKLNKNDLIERNREIASVAYLTGYFDKSETALDDILKLLPDDIKALNERGLIYLSQGELNKAEQYLRRVLDLAKEQQKGEPLIGALNNLALIYTMRGNLDLAEEMHLLSLEIAQKYGFKEIEAGNYSNLA
jgi:tetratricopeptide (TPR) repeat protein